MKLLSAIACVALAGAVAPPRIELSLEGMTKSTSVDTDWTERCPAATTTSEANCPFPVAHAFDHNNQAIDVTTTVERVTSASGTAQPVTASNGSYDVQWDEPAIYLFKYQAKDSVGNTAEHIVFELVLDDLTKPEITCNAATQTLEVFQNDPTTQDAVQQCTFSDNIAQPGDIDVTYDVIGTVYSLVDGGRNRTKTHKHFSSYTAMNTYFHEQATLEKRGKFTVGILARDNAGMFGAHGEDNVQHASFELYIEDNVAPTITLEGGNPTIECGTPYTNVSGVWTNTDTQTTMSEDQLNKGNSKYSSSRPYKSWRDPGVTVTDLYDTDLSQAMAQPCDINDPTKCLDVLVAGNYTITYTATDASGNVGSQTRTVHVVDDEAPKIAIIGGPLQYHQKTAEAYDDPGIRVWDNCDFYGSNATSNGTHVSYANVSNGQLSDLQSNVRVWYTHDTDGACSNTAAHLSWSELDLSQGGKYWKHYQAEDSAGNVSPQACRKITIVDEEKPILSIEWNSQVSDGIEMVDASTSLEYQDEGATCTDYVHGNLNRAVRSTGDIVNRAKVGTYYVTYTCKDPSGNHAEPMTKTIIVRDETCPTITLESGTQEISIEAGFPYVDQEPACSDDFSSACIKKVYGNTVNYARAFKQSPNCETVKAAYSEASTGYYLLTPTGGPEVSAFCDMENVRTYFRKDDFVGSACLTDMCEGSYDSGSLVTDCFSVDENEKAYYPRNGDEQHLVGITSMDEGQCVIFSQAGIEGVQNKTVLCSELVSEAELAHIKHSVKDSHNFCSWQEEANRNSTHGVPTFANSGTESFSRANLYPVSNGASADDPTEYVIKYHYTDAAGNTGACPSNHAQYPNECKCPKERTVHVKDSLPPVITLKLNDNLVAVSGGGQTGHGHYNTPTTFQSSTSNPAYINAAAGGEHNPFLMAESTTSVNGWAVAAVASFITGVALLSYSGKSATTSVPV
jgi:hypothetical protein